MKIVPNESSKVKKNKIIYLTLICIPLIYGQVHAIDPIENEQTNQGNLSKDPLPAYIASTRTKRTRADTQDVSTIELSSLPPTHRIIDSASEATTSTQSTDLAQPSKLAKDVGSFKTLIENGYVYVDKTEYIYHLLQDGNSYFLSRPRRFGKTLLISTLKEIFKPNQELFKDLWIDTHSNYNWPEHPVIHFDFSDNDAETADQFENDLKWELEQIAQTNGLDVTTAPSLKKKLKSLVKQLAQKKNQKVVILIDEYDSPLLENITNKTTAKQINTKLKKFYITLKSLSDQIHFLFITGIAKFSKTSLFSGMNIPNDITMKPEAHSLLGYTEKEIKHYFSPHIKAFSQEKNITIQSIMNQMREWYNGYQFSELPIKVYNPLSVMYFLHDKKLDNYWFETSTPSFLIDLIKTQEYVVPKFDKLILTKNELSTFEVDDIPLHALMFQTGYLTIDSFNPETIDEYTLDFPNREVQKSFFESLSNKLTKASTVTTRNTCRSLIKALEKNDLGQFHFILKTFFAGIPYSIQMKYENYYQLTIYVIAKLLGLETDVEVQTNQGRIDMIIRHLNTLYIFEFKINKSAKVASKQIEKMNYPEQYQLKHPRMFLIGINFDTKKRNITKWIAKERVIENGIIKERTISPLKGLQSKYSAWTTKTYNFPKLKSKT